MIKMKRVSAATRFFLSKTTIGLNYVIRWDDVTGEIILFDYYLKFLIDNFNNFQPTKNVPSSVPNCDLITRFLTVPIKHNQLLASISVRSLSEGSRYADEASSPTMKTKGANALFDILRSAHVCTAMSKTGGRN